VVRRGALVASLKFAGLGLFMANVVQALTVVTRPTAAVTRTAIAGANAGPLANPDVNRQIPALAIGSGACTSVQGSVRCPSPCFPKPVWAYNASRACTDLLLAAINQSQVSEHVAGFTLPTNYFGLGLTRQMFVLINLERISRNVPPLVGLSPYLNAAAATAARQAQDPSFQKAYGPVRVWAPPGGGNYAFGGVWAGNSVNAAAALFGWFYADGWGGKAGTPNLACTSPTASGCWGHRDALLGEWAGTRCTDCVAGAGYSAPAERNWKESYDFLIVRPANFPTPLVFTWNGDVVPYLPAGWERAKTAP